MLLLVVTLPACQDPAPMEVVAEDAPLGLSPGPALVETLPPAAVPRVVVNEIMADNESTLQEADGSFSDWFEIYNTSG